MNGMNGLTDYITQINKLKLYKKDNEFITNTESLLLEATKFLTQIKTQIKSLENAISDGYSYLEEVIDEFTYQTDTHDTCEAGTDFVFQTKNGMLSYKDKCLYGISRARNIPKKNDTQSNIQIKELRIVQNKTKMRQIDDLHTLQPAIAYYAGDKKYPEGIYMCLGPEIYVRIPFPQIIDSKEQNKYKTVRCKYKTKKICDEQKSKMAGYHGSSLRSCNFAHKGDRMIKIGYQSRCPSVPNFGDPETFNKDCATINVDDVKSLLFYGLNDLALAVLAMQIRFDQYSSNNKATEDIAHDMIDVGTV